MVLEVISPQNGKIYCNILEFLIVNNVLVIYSIDPPCVWLVKYITLVCSRILLLHKIQYKNILKKLDMGSDRAYLIM